MAFGTESGFPKFSLKKYLGGDSVSGKAVHVWHFFSKNLFLKMICRIWTLWFKIKNRDKFESPGCSKPQMNGTGLALPGRLGASTISGDSAGDLESLTRTRDILF